MVESLANTIVSDEARNQHLANSILSHLNEHPEGIANTDEFAHATGIKPSDLDSILKSLVAEEYISVKHTDKKLLELTEEGHSYLTKGTPEYQLASALTVGEVTEKARLEEQLGAEVVKIGSQKALQLKWLKAEGKTALVRLAENIEDVDKNLLQAFVDRPEVSAHSNADVEKLKKRKLIQVVTQKTYAVSKGANFAPVRQKQETDLTADMIKTGAWKDKRFKNYNFNAQGQAPEGGHLHPLLKVRSYFREILLEMGFNEMPTDKYVESSFWNFDTLFQPQSHPARDMHDTFFLKNPAQCKDFPEEYGKKVQEVHEKGGYGSLGYKYQWDKAEAQKNLLRTHTTAISSKMLYQLAEDYKKTGIFKPMKYFSIDRVFRNENLDATHLAEFHQVEGFIADRNIGLSHLLGIMQEFYARIGIKQLKYKPAYNPYTEPSLEIFGFHPQLKRWVEIGNSGVFRPEMLRPMGLPEDVSVIAWGLSLERPTMIYYGLSNIRDLFGHKVSLSSTKENKICYINP